MDELVRDVSTAVEASAADLVIVRYPTDCLPLGRELADGADRKMLSAGTLMYWEDRRTDVTSGTTLAVHLSQPVDLREADALLADAFRDYRNHYSYNPQTPAHVTTTGYLQWARTRLESGDGTGIVLYDDSGRAIGLATVRSFETHKEVLEVELAGISVSAQAAGNYARLWGLVRAFADHAGVARILISTQVANVDVQRAWARLGLLPLAAYDTVHLSRRSK
jgi:hypothetical protein